MNFQEEFYLDVPAREAWEFFTDLPAPVRILPGLTSLRQSGPHTYEGEVRAQVGPCNFQFQGQLHILKVDHNTHTVVIQGKAQDGRAGSHFEATARARVFAAGPDRTCVRLEVQVGLGGLLGKTGALFLKPKARELVRCYAQLSQREISRRAAQPIPA